MPGTAAPRLPHHRPVGQISTHILSSVPADQPPQRQAPPLPLPSPKLLHIYLVAQPAPPPDRTVTCPRGGAVPVCTSRVGDAPVAPVPAPPHLALALPWLVAAPVLPVTVLPTDRPVTQPSGPAWRATALQRAGTCSVLAAGRGPTLCAIDALPTLLALALAGSSAETVFGITGLRTFGDIAENARVSLITQTLKTLFAVAIFAAGHLHAVLAVFS